MDTPSNTPPHSAQTTPYTDMPDEGVAAHGAESHAAVAELIHRYEKKLDAYIRRRSNCSQKDREDILQNVFIKMYTNIREFDTSLLFSSWIYRIAHNEMIDWYRKHGTRRTVSLEADEGLFAKIAADIDVEHTARVHELQAAVRTAVADLPDDYREILMLRYFEEKSYDEIADILKLPPGTVAIRINRAKKKLAEPLAHIAPESN